MEEKRVTNQKEEYRKNTEWGSDLGFLELLKATPEGSTLIERKGHEEFSQSSQLPVEINHGGTIEDLKELGVEFLGVSPKDEMFYDVKLPKGWKKIRQSGYDYWTDLVDEKEKVVASIFYKAVAWDRDAFMNINVGGKKN